MAGMAAGLRTAQTGRHLLVSVVADCHGCGNRGARHDCHDCHGVSWCVMLKYWLAMTRSNTQTSCTANVRLMFGRRERRKRVAN